MAKKDKTSESKTDDEVIDIDMLTRSHESIDQPGQYIVLDVGFSAMGMRIVPGAYDNAAKALVGEIVFEHAPKLQYDALSIVSRLKDEDLAELLSHSMVGMSDKSFWDAVQKLEQAKHKAGDKLAIEMDHYRELFERPGTSVQSRTILE